MLFKLFLIGNPIKLVSEQFSIWEKIEERFKAAEKEMREMTENLQRLPRLEQMIEGLKEDIDCILLALKEPLARRMLHKLRMECTAPITNWKREKLLENCLKLI